MITVVDQNTLEAALPLIRAYQTFYGCPAISADTNREHFRQFGPDSEKGCLFLYTESGVAVAFATVYFTYSSTLPGKVGVMNDLFTQEAYRGKGIGRKLIDHCLSYATSQGAHRLQWLTATRNETAQRLYDSLSVKKSDWHFYTYTGA